MKKLGQVIQNLSTTNLESSMNESTTSEDVRRARIVWSKLAALFGHAFLRENGSDPLEEWVRYIAKTSDADLQKGLANLGNAGLHFPPNLSVFGEACTRQEEARPWLNPNLQRIEDKRPRGKMSRADWLAIHPEERAK